MIKELFNIGKAKDAIEIVDQKQIKKEIKLIGSQRRVPGLTLWEYNTITGKLVMAEFEKVNHTLTFNKKAMDKRYSVKTNDNCVYFQALNEKNAIKKLNKVMPR